MNGASSEKKTRERRAKAKIRKSGSSAKRKVAQLGEDAGVFSAVVYFNPTYGRLEGAIHVPDGQSIPDMNRFLEHLWNSLQSTSQKRISQETQTLNDLHDKAAAETGSPDMDAEAEEKMDANADFYHSIAVNGNSADWVGNPKAGHDSTLPVAGDTHNETQHSRDMGIQYHQMPDSAVHDSVSGRDTSMNMFDVGGQDVFEGEEARNKAQTGRSEDVSDWEKVNTKNAEATTTTGEHAGSARNQALKVRRFLRRVSLRMRLATRQERLPLHHIAHQEVYRRVGRGVGI
ncbi:hypothetical protein CSUB01_08018 [Colletotrichum sublineola]|uniref:Uncharacterized protein n=1 Tax=Colletotrichum sublineola TaxID=1173701 RepID=A0A066WTL0_COLSU|nr:hypothetical protein CSUB01_08018 [Colletotrichum sublineola]